MFSWAHSRAKRVAAITTIMLGVLCIILLCVAIKTRAGYLPPEYNEDIPLVGGDEVLKMVHLVFRHGQRTPADTYPNDIYINETFYPYGWGQLTNVSYYYFTFSPNSLKYFLICFFTIMVFQYGKLTVYNIGNWAHRRYGSFLGDVYQPELMHAQSTGVSRTQMSLALALAGLWPPHNTPLEWNPVLNWQPTPFTYEKLDEDTLLLVRVSCPRYYEELDRVLNSGEIKDLLESNEQLFEELTRITGSKIETPDDVQSLYSTLKAEEEFGLTLPEWTKSYYPDKLQNLTDFSYVLGVYNDELKRIKGGPFLKKTLDEWKAAGRNDPKAKKIYVYAGHDATVVNILSAFNAWTPQFPDYAFMAVFELYENVKTGVLSVQVIFLPLFEYPLKVINEFFI